jgi:hypothetical protein
MRLDEMRAMVETVAGTTCQFEAFVAREFCINSSAICFATHGYGHQAHFCCDYTSRRLVDENGTHVRDLPDFTEHWHEDHDFLRAFSALHRCGFCSLGELLDMGVKYLKVPGRSSSAIAAVKLLRKLLDGGDLSADACRTIVDSQSFCESGHFCYYEPAGRLAEKSQVYTPPTMVTRGLPNLPEIASDDARGNEAALGLYLTVGNYPETWVPRLVDRACIGELIDGESWGMLSEREASRRTLSQIAALGISAETTIDRVVLGAEVCALRLRAGRTILDEVTRWTELGYRVDLVMPVAFQAYWKQAQSLIDCVLTSCASTEVVVNDIGLLRHATRKWPGRVSVGRLFNRMKRDQFALAGAEVCPDTYATHPQLAGQSESHEIVTPLIERQRTCFGYPYLRERTYAELLAESSVERIAWDVLPSPLTASLPDGFEATLYAPWTYSSSSRACATAIALEGAASSYPTQHCGRPCERNTVIPEYSWLDGQVIQRGTATFIDMSAHVGGFMESMKPAPSRLVFQPLVPF